MTTNHPASSTKYGVQRRRVTPPSVGLKEVRAALGLTLDQVIGRMNEEFPAIRPTRGALSAVENGHRGASEALLEAWAAALGLPSGSLTTDYSPRARPTLSS